MGMSFRPPFFSNRLLPVFLLVALTGTSTLLSSPVCAAGGAGSTQTLGVLHRPRIFFPGLQQVERLRQRYQEDSWYRGQVDRWTAGASRWLCAGDEEQGQAALTRLLRTEVHSPNARADYGNGLELALQYDLLADYPGWSQGKRQQVEGLLQTWLREALAILDADSASLWHGRFQLSCSAWVVAAVLDRTQSENISLTARARAYFLEGIKAIELSGGWPEGYSYWINNRAYPFVLACLAHLNSVEQEEVNGRIRQVLREIGLWTIYGTEPVNRFVLFGDTGPRNDLKYETQRVIDLIFLATRNPVFLDYSGYLDQRFGRAGYYQGYRWGRPVFRGLPELDFPAGDTLRDLTVFEGVLPHSRLFGPEGMGQAFIRSGWGPGDTFIYYQAGHSFSHHGHYQAGHFSISRSAPLAIKSGTYGGFTSEHRLNYYIRTVAANSLLVLKPGENVSPNGLFGDNVAAGGQRLVMPTGSAVTSVRNWRGNLYKGRHYEGGRITAFENQDPDYVYLNSDLTGAYNSVDYDENGGRGKVALVTRQLLYLKKIDLLIVRDRVEAVSKDYTVKWLLHSWNKPETEHEIILEGEGDNGILESEDSSFTIGNGRGVLEVEKLLPENGVIRKIGGPDFRYYVETDGDDSDLDGRNMKNGAKEKNWFDAGNWRVEIQPDAGRKSTEFLMLLKPGLKGKGSARPDSRLVKSPDISGVIIGSTLIGFSRKGLIEGERIYPFGEDAIERVILLDFPPRQRFALKTGEKVRHLQSSDAGVLSFEMPREVRAKSCTVWPDRP